MRNANLPGLDWRKNAGSGGSSVGGAGWLIDGLSWKALAFSDTAVDGRVLSWETECREAGGDEEEDAASGTATVSGVVVSVAGIVPAPTPLRRSARR